MSGEWKEKFYPFCLRARDWIRARLICVQFTFVDSTRVQSMKWATIKWNKRKKIHRHKNTGNCTQTHINILFHHNMRCAALRLHLKMWCWLIGLFDKESDWLHLLLERCSRDMTGLIYYYCVRARHIEAYLFLHFPPTLSLALSLSVSCVCVCLSFPFKFVLISIYLIAQML